MVRSRRRAASWHPRRQCISSASMKALSLSVVASELPASVLWMPVARTPISTPRLDSAQRLERFLLCDPLSDHHRENRGCASSYNEHAEVQPRHRQGLRRWIEDAREHLHQHLRDPEPGRETEHHSGDEKDQALSPEKRAELTALRAHRGKQREIAAPLDQSQSEHQTARSRDQQNR